VAELDQLPIVTLTYSPQSGWNTALKRAIDLVGAIVGLVLCALPMMVIAVLIRVCDGTPIFYSQVRAGFSCRPFRIIKFRTMVVEHVSRCEAEADSQDHLRVTTIGRVLRKTSLDELPQLLNVLLGQMSLVGPRPERPEIIERLRHRIPGYMLRGRVKAGMTGLAQIHGWRGRTSLRKRIQYDLYYVSHWSLMLDVRILFATILGGFIHPG
jgi:lipopolysaccharide/colanic/teichoic acid biosynthesis glycosyltransferase